MHEDQAKTILNKTVPEISTEHVAVVRRANLAHAQEVSAANRARAADAAAAEEAHKLALCAAETIHSSSAAEANLAKTVADGTPKKILKLGFCVILATLLAGIPWFLLGILQLRLLLLSSIAPILLGSGLAGYGALCLLHARTRYAATIKSIASQRSELIVAADARLKQALAEADLQLNEAKKSAEKRRTEAVTKALEALDSLQRARPSSGIPSPTTSSSAKTVLAPTLAMPAKDDSGQSKL